MLHLALLFAPYAVNNPSNCPFSKCGVDGQRLATEQNETLNETLRVLCDIALNTTERKAKFEVDIHLMLIFT